VVIPALPVLCEILGTAHAECHCGAGGKGRGLPLPLSPLLLLAAATGELGSLADSAIGDTPASSCPKWVAEPGPGAKGRGQQQDTIERAHSGGRQVAAADGQGLVGVQPARAPLMPNAF
jgi:hypothetical protein